MEIAVFTIAIEASIWRSYTRFNTERLFELTPPGRLRSPSERYPVAPLPRRRSREASQEVISAVARSSSQARWKRRKAAAAVASRWIARDSKAATSSIQGEECEEEEEGEVLDDR
ncbi:MAG TPA: hypothetical protein VF179_09255 [Thermoanaerobaculia bacterium]|nr:hypothetical protein [Thermoanaerobaculia bacterium]